MSNSPHTCVDPVLLRRALRLVHCLQKERGASCAYYASRHEVKIVDNMEKARIDSDRSIQMMLRGREEIKVHATLMKIRKMVHADDTVSNHAAPGEEKRVTSCHRILVCFNALISSIVHDSFMEKIAVQERTMHLRRQSNHSRTGRTPHVLPGSNKLPGQSAFKKGHNRAKSTGDCFFYSEADLGFDNDDDAAGGQEQRKRQQYTFLNLNPGSAPKLIDSRHIPDGPPPLSLDEPGNPPAALRKTRADSFDSPHNGKSHVQFEVNPDDPEVVLSRLLHLLACFVKLKESTGVERAVLSSLVVSGREDSLLMSDLVLEVENQRRLLDELKHLPFGSLRNLVQELVEMSEPLRELQQRILTNFDLEGIIITDQEHDVNTIWDLITVYIDKLHSLELLIIEEVEYCLPSVEHSHDHHFEKHSHPTLLESEFINNLFGSSALSDGEVRSRLEKMPAEEIKDKLLRGLVPDNSQVSNASSHHQHDISLAGVNGVIDDPLLLIPNLPASKEWEINLYELKFLKRIGEGAAGTTYLAKWTGLQVAVKVASITETGLDGWRTEVQALQKLHHPNIIRLLGSVYHPNPLTFCLVLEYCNAGDLANALKYPTAPGFFFHVATSVAKGVAYLHSRGVMHRDIKPDNILCDGNVRSGNFTVKVSDFGVATDTSVLGDRTAETGTYRWMSPEVIRHESYSNMADVYSYAVVLWQLITREDPYMNLSQIEAAGKVALEKARPPFPAGTPEAVVTFVETCWSEDPNSRWPFEQICEKLPQLESSLMEAHIKFLDAPLGRPVYYPRDYESVDDVDEEDHAEHKRISLGALSHHNHHKKKDDKGKDEKRKSGFFKIKMFGR